MSNIIILHAPDSLVQAKMLVRQLDLMDYLASTFDSLTRHSSRTAIQAARKELFAGAPAIVIMGSPQLFGEDFYTQTAILATEVKTHVPVLYGQIGLELPAWFSNPIVLVGPDTDPERSWNRFLQKLNSLIGYF